ncbi:EcsC family protein [Aquibacillus koreensis]|uniref:EcsC family protein n=1 Tax=Aquibacillus koreensis TaxID=279446 RepID=A0A9X3WJ28_9BACI|nr:EcsC family protein [Aquibacillus koreensis]MCT2534984.1 EcsC family protein [Aquibacillus koreensis]MDC3419271.1 EcsC family protein [Aquibacillus koreensis]
MSEKNILKEISDWEHKLESYQSSDLERVYDNWKALTMNQISPSIKQGLFSNLDNFLFHTHAYLQGSSMQMEARNRILTIARVFDPDIDAITDLNKLSIDQLTYLAQQQISKGRMHSFMQGGMTGTGGILLTGIDFPLLVIMNLRVVQLIGLSFGHEMNHPFEMMLSLKVFHAATLPKRFQNHAWEDLMKEIETTMYMYEGDDKLTDPTWIDQPMKQIGKNILILIARKKLLQGIPLISIGIGAFSNYQLTSQVTNYALRFYQKRLLLRKGIDNEKAKGL